MSLFFDEKRLSNQDIIRMLKESDWPNGSIPSDELIDTIVKEFWFYDYYVNLISDPIFYGFLYDYLKNKRPNSFNRPDFYHYFFRKIVPNEPSFLQLQEIGLIFEKLQTDTVDLEKFDEQVKKTYGDDFIFTSKWLIDNKFTSEVKDEKEPNKINLRWAHHSLTEYLTADHILLKKDPVKEAEKLMILKQEGIVAFKSSWTGVLSFLFESDKRLEFINWAINFAKKYPDTLDENFCKLLTFKPQNIGNKLKEKIFDLIYKNYQKRLLWIPPFTRRNLGQFISKKQYSTLEKDLKVTKNETKTFVRRGNVVTVISSMFENNSDILTVREKNKWKKILIKFANDKNKNGVLQRTSLSALSQYKDENIIDKVKINFESTDTLVKEAFVQFCYETAPNSIISINYMVKAIKQGVTIYGRYGLYEVKGKKGMLYLLENFSKDPELLKIFLDRESIFDKEEGYGDKLFLKNINNLIDKDIVNALKQIIFTAFDSKRFYIENKSIFLREIMLMIASQEKNFLFEILDKLKDKKEKWLFYEYSLFIKDLITLENVGRFIKKLKEINNNDLGPAQSAIYNLKREGGTLGEKIYKEALKYDIKPIDEIRLKAMEYRAASFDKDIYENFIKKLKPAPNKYFPDVFEFFKDNKEKIEKYWKEEDKKLLLKLAFLGLEKIDPKKIKVTIKDKANENRQFTWSTVASYYGKIIAVVNILTPEELKKYRQNIINFIPYAYSDDQSTILEVIKTITDKELAWVNKIYSKEYSEKIKDDARYLEPSSYIYLTSEYKKRGCKLISPIKTLISFVTDSIITNHERRYALEQLVNFIDKKDKKIKKFLINDLIKKRDKSDQNRQLSNIANSLLITVYKDKKAIEWRFKQIKDNVLRFQKPQPMVAHSVGPIEEEISDMNFARPLINLNDPKYLPYFFSLIDYSVKILKKNDEVLWEYINYLWRIVISYVEKLKTKELKSIIRLEKYIRKYQTINNINWLEVQVKELRKKYINQIIK